MLLMAACLIFADGLRPAGGYVSAADFVVFRERRLRAMRWRVNAGMALFTAAVALTTVLALVLLAA